jgi:hypothetical protein
MTQPNQGNWGPPQNQGGYGPPQGGGYGPPQGGGYGPPPGQGGFSNYQPPQPPPQPPKKKRTGRNVVLAIIAVIVVIAIATSAGGGSGSSSNTAKPATGESTSSAKSDSGTKAGTVLLSLTGSGTKQTQKFTTGSDDWDVAYTYDCSNFGGTGNFILTPTGEDGAPSFTNTGINDLGAGKSDVTHYHHGGTYFLDINSECKWTVKVTTA